jgi:glycosyltransferase involved in cell wall biosynthesis
MVTRIPGIAGPANFQRRLEVGLKTRGIGVSYDLRDEPYEVVLVIGATRNLLGLWRVRKRGIPVVQRLNGMNWIHRRIPTGLRHSVRAEINNLLLRTIRKAMSDHVIYQSQFAKGWWEGAHGESAIASSVVYNGVPLDVFTHDGDHDRPIDRIVVLMVEGNLGGGYEVGLEMGVQLTSRLQSLRKGKIELRVAGNVAPQVQSKWDTRDTPNLEWLGLIPTEQISRLDRSAHVLYSSDLNPACPNAVLEALASGLPVVAYDTGALPEIVIDNAGKLASYGGDPWSLDPPDVDALVEAAMEVLDNQEEYRIGARARAEAQFGIDQMVDGYLHVFRNML